MPMLTQDEFMALQQECDPLECRGYEYEHGELLPLAPIDGQHSSPWSHIVGTLGCHVMDHDLGKLWIDLLTYLEPDGSIRYFPDIVYLAPDVLDRFDGTKVIGAPTLVVEVTTPTSDSAERGRKQRSYHAAGVPWYWIVDTRLQATEEYRWEEEACVPVSQTPFPGAFRPTLFPGFEITLSA